MNMDFQNWLLSFLNSFYEIQHLSQSALSFVIKSEAALCRESFLPQVTVLMLFDEEHNEAENHKNSLKICKVELRFNSILSYLNPVYNLFNKLSTLIESIKV